MFCELPQKIEGHETQPRAPSRERIMGHATEFSYTQAEELNNAEWDVAINGIDSRYHKDLYLVCMLVASFHLASVQPYGEFKDA